MREKFNIKIISKSFNSYRYIKRIKDYRIKKLFIRRLIIKGNILQIHATIKLRKKQRLPIGLIRDININLTNFDNKYVGISVK